MNKVPSASFLGKSICCPVADTRAMNVHRDAVLVRAKNSLHFVFTKCIQEIGKAEGSILDA